MGKIEVTLELPRNIYEIAQGLSFLFDEDFEEFLERNIEKTIKILLEKINPTEIKRIHGL